MMYFKGNLIEKIGYCKCASPVSVTSENDDWDTGMSAVSVVSHLKMGSIIMITMMVKTMMI